MGEVKAPEQTVFLFVGGPLDGQRRGVEPGAGGLPPSYFRCLKRPSTTCWDRLEASVLGPQIETYDYELMSFTDADDKHHSVYVGNDVSDPLARLLAGYRPEEKS